MTGIGIDTRRSPLRRELVASVMMALVVVLGAFIAGVVAEAGENATSLTSVVVTTAAPPSQLAAPSTPVAHPLTTAAPLPTPAPLPPTTAAPLPTPAPLPPTTAAPPPTVSSPVVVEVAVDSTTPWTDTGIDVAPGDAVSVVAMGEIAHDIGQPSSRVGADGDPRPELSVFNLVNGEARLDGPHAGLVARISEERPFVLGARASLTAESTGRLLLGVNDAGLDNNEGAFTVTLTR